MCGIAGFSGRKRLSKEQALIAANKMKILGLFNESRGSHGCGLYVNGKIFKGIDDLATKKDTKLFKNFIADPSFVWPKLDTTHGNIMILHTRMATSGAHTEANTHPFYVPSVREGDDIVGVHNGTIDNIWELCKKHDFDYLDHHIRVDSQALYYLIDRVGLDILTQYRGAAALVWSKPSDPRSLFVYHGMSKKDRTDQKVYIERPLFYLKSEEGTYFSSMENSLQAIRESDKQKVLELECNKVMKLTDGNFTEFTFEVDRLDANLVFPTYGTVGVQQQYPVDRGGHNTPFRNLREAVVSRKKETKRLAKALGTPKEALVWKETKPAKALGAKDQEVIYFWKGRYHRSGGDNLCSGILYIGDRGVIGNETMESFKPFWFFHGVMMRGVEAYEALVVESNLPNSWVNNIGSNYAYDISRFAAHPVTHLISEAVDSDPFFRYSWYLNERRVEDCKLRPDFSGRCYEIKDGFLHTIIGSNGNDKITLEGVQNEDPDGSDDELIIDGQHYPSQRIPTLGCDGDTCSTEAVPWRSKTSIFDIVFADIEILTGLMSREETEAVAMFVEDQLKKEGAPHDPRTVTAEMWTAIRTGCVTGRTIREAVGDKTSVLEAYLAILKNEKQLIQQGPRMLPAIVEHEDEPLDVDSIEEMIAAGEEVMSNMHQAYMEFSKDRDKETPFPNSLDDISVTSFHEADFVEEEETDEPLIDAAVREDHRRDIDQAFQQEGLLVEAIKSCEEIITTLGELSSDAEKLSINHSDMARDVCSTLNQGLDSIKSALTEDFDRYHQDVLVKALYLEVPSNI